MSNANQPLSSDIQRLSSELARIEQRLRSEIEPDAMVLNEFRQALDNTRLTAWGISELIHAKSTGKDQDTVHAFVTSERVRRFEQLVKNLCGDIERRAGMFQSHAIQSLFDSMNTLKQRLTRSFSQHRGRNHEVEEEAS